LIATKQNEISDLKAKKAVKDGSATQQQGMIESTNKNVLTLNDQKTKGTADKSQFEANKAFCLTNYNTCYDNFVKEVELQGAAAEVCRTNLIKETDITKYNTCVNTILPVENQS